MEKKTELMVSNIDGNREFYKGDTILAFIIDNADEFLSGEVDKVNADVYYAGLGIPQPIFAETIGSLVLSFIENTYKNKALAAFFLHEVSKILEAGSAKIMSEMRKEDMDGIYAGAVKEVLKEMLCKTSI